jgi:ribosomal protein S18 acetylase RimI-like enzyme
MAIAELGPGDAGEVLTLQRAAYVTEAQLYGDPFLPALTQDIADLTTEMSTATTYGARTDGRLVGAVRVLAADTVAQIGRLVVAPDHQGRGIGSTLMAHVHSQPPPGVESFELFTGARSEANLSLYRRLGYVESRRETMNERIELVFLARAATC